jgi:hypothetical protein
MSALILKHLVLVATFGCAFLAVGYEDDARRRGWPVGTLLSGNAPWLKILAVIALLVSLAVSFYAFYWWTPLITAVLGFVFGLIATLTMGPKVQLLAIVGTILGWVLCLVYVARGSGT